MTDSEIALIHYRLQFPSLESLGAAPECGQWKAEYDRLASSGFSATLIVQSTSDAGSATAQRNFDQKELLSALILRRAELDPDFEATMLVPAAIKPRLRLGITVRTW